MHVPLHTCMYLYMYTPIEYIHVRACLYTLLYCVQHLHACNMHVAGNMLTACQVTCMLHAGYHKCNMHGGQSSTQHARNMHVTCMFQSTCM